MRIAIKEKINPNVEKYRKEDMDIAYSFAKELNTELGNLLKAVVIFGSSARQTSKPKSDIDLLVILDDVTVNFTRDMVEAYRIIVQKLIVKISPKIHVTTVRFTSFWEYIKNADPVGINMLRDGVALIDTGFFDPLQILLKRGRIRPSEEAIWSYYTRAPNTLHNSRWHIMQAVVDLYWAVIDAAHAALMKHGEIPPTPEHVADLLDEKLVKKKLLEHKYVSIMRNFYRLSKMILHREITELKGEEYDRHYHEARDFIERMRKFIE